MVTGPVENKQADLVLAGGGVKGIGLVGAVVALMDDGYTFQRVSGTSAGAVVGSIVAAAAHGQQSTSAQVKDLAFGLDYRKCINVWPFDGVPVAGRSWALLRGISAALRGTGIYRSDYVHDWLRGELKNLGVSTFGDLRLDDDELPEERRYRLVVNVTDVTTGQLVRLPWDYRRLYGLDPDDQPVADAVRASMSIPFMFRAVSLTDTNGLTSTLVDGGLLSNLPIDSLDRTDGKPPRWPSFGVTVLPNLPAGNDKVIPALAPLRLLRTPHLLEHVIATVLVGRDQTYLNQPWVSARAIRVDSTNVGVLNFSIARADMEALYENGYAAAQQFLSTWDWPTYVKRFRSP